MSNKPKNPHGGHRARIRQRYLSAGLNAFADHEVLELLLYYAYPRCDTNEIAHHMLHEFGSLPHLFEAEVPVLMEKLNCSENIAVLLNLIPALAQRYFHSKWNDKIEIKNSTNAGEYALSLFMGLTHERFFVACLNTRNFLIHAAKISDGTLNETPVYTREVVKAAVQNQASAVILMHNHPGGTITPSKADIEVTRHIKTELEMMNIPLIDHIIVAGDAYYSFAARRQHVEGYA